VTGFTVQSLPPQRARSRGWLKLFDLRAKISEGRQSHGSNLFVDKWIQFSLNRKSADPSFFKAANHRTPS
jgi:hypothetical protein